MSFPFPPNPVDGQVATQTQPDGTVLRATYQLTKNEWVVERVAPKDPTLMLTAGTPYTVNPGKDGQVLTYDKATNQWIGKTPADSGGKGQTFTKGTQAATDTPNPPDPTRPKEMLQAGALQTTLENLHKELKAWNGSAWVNVLTEEEIKQWIAAGSLFRGVVDDATLNTLPTPAVANRGFYWSWTGNPGHTVSGTDAKISPDLDNEVLQVGDWIQSDGTKWVHVPGDLLSKQRWDSLGSFQPWSDTSWESGSVVSYQKSFFRASALVAKGDLAPGASPGNPGEVQKWVDITPIPHMSTGDLNNVNANTIDGGGRTHGAVFQWDDNIGEWVSSDTLEVSEVQTDTIRLGGQLGGEIYYFEEVDLASVDPADDGNTAASVYAIKEYIKNQPIPFLEELEDCKELATAEDGQVPVWSDANSRWEPKSLTTPILYLGTGAWNAANVADAAQKYGMAADTVPDPTVWAPVPGDQYIDLTTGTITVFQGAGGTSNPTRRAGAITGGAQPGLDALIEDLGGLADVALTTPADGEVLTYDGASSQWVNKASSGKGISQWTDAAHTAGELVIYEGRLYEATQDIARDSPPPIADTTKTTGIAVCGTVTDGTSVKLTVHNSANTERSVTITATAAETTPAGLATALAAAANADAGMSQWATFRAAHSFVYVMGKSEAILVKPTVPMISAAASSSTTKNNWNLIGHKDTGGPHFVTLTQAQYDALATKDPTALYLIHG